MTKYVGFRAATNLGGYLCLKPRNNSNFGAETKGKNKSNIITYPCLGRADKTTDASHYKHKYLPY